MNPTFDASSSIGGGGDGLWSAMTRIFGLSMFASMFFSTGRDTTTATAGGGGGGRDSVRLIVLGMLFELGRRFVKWVFERFRIRM